MRMLAARGPAALPLPAPVCCAGKPCCLPACHNPPVPLRPAVPRIHAISKLLREDDETPMTMFFGFMGLLIFLSVGPPAAHPLVRLLRLPATALPGEPPSHAAHCVAPPADALPPCPRLAAVRLAGVELGAMSWRMLGAMVAKGLLDNVLSDYLWARAILLVGEYCRGLACERVCRHSWASV